MSYPLLSSLNPGGQPARPSRAVVPNLFGTIHLEQWSPAFLAPETCFFFFSFLRSVFWKTVFPWSTGKEGDTVMIQVFIYCALYFFMTSAPPQIIRHYLDPGGWDLCSGETTVACTASWFLLLFFLCSRVGMPASSAPHYCPALNPAFFIYFLSKVATDFYLKQFS